MADTDSSTSSGQSAGGIVVPELQGGQEIYDRIMGGIEPELVSSQVSLLDEKYKNETPDEKIARSERYKKAFEEYDKQYAEEQKKLNADDRNFERSLMQSVESDVRKEDEDALGSLESAISSI